MANTIKDIVEKILGDGGVAYAGKYTKRDPQYRYAMVVAENMQRGNQYHTRGNAIDMTSVACVEGACGIGKGCAYLVPLLADAALTGKRVAISTYTRALQKQILTEDLPQVSEWIAEVTGIRLSFAPRFGISAYVSYHRAEVMVEAILSDSDLKISKLDRNLLIEFVKWSKICTYPESELFNRQVHTGIIADFLEAHGLQSLPAGLNEANIALHYNDNSDEKKFLERDQKLSKQSDVLVVTHAMMLLNNLRFYKILDDDRKIEGVVFDEADHLESVAESIYRQDIPIHSALNLLNSAHELLPLFNETLDAFQDLSDVLLNEYSKDIKILKPRDSFALKLQASISRCNKALLEPTDVCVNKIRQSTLPPDSMAILQDCVEFRNSLQQYSESLSSVLADETPWEVPAVSWSPVRQYPSLQIIPTNPGTLVGRLWAGFKNEAGEQSNYVKHALFTSATLGVKNKSGVFNYSDFAKSIGIFVDRKSGLPSSNRLALQKDLSVSFEPTNFGRMLFVLADPVIPRPFKKGIDIISDNNYVHDPHWLDYAVSMIRFAQNNPSIRLPYNRTLVLCNSYSDAYALQLELEGLEGVILHKRGTSLDQYLHDFKSDPSSILITPSAWEGLSLPSTIANIAIPRIPIINVDSSHSKAMIHYYKSKGISESQAESIIFGQSITKGKRKLKQGFGRGIRTDTDQVRILISDSRFQLPSEKEYRTLSLKKYMYPISIKSNSPKMRPSKSSSGYSEAIPERFRIQGGAYENSHIFMKNGEINRLQRLSGVV